MGVSDNLLPEMSLTLALPQMGAVTSIPTHLWFALNFRELVCLLNGVL